MLGRLKSTIPILQIYLPKKANTEKLGLGIDNPCRIVFLSLRMNKCLERSWSRQLRNDTKMSPQLKRFFKAEGFGLPCTAWAGSGLLVKSRLIGSELSRELANVPEHSRYDLCLLRRGVTFP